VALKLHKFRLLFMDGTTETIESIGLFLAWFKGKLRAAEKRTVLFKVEEVHESTCFSPSAQKRFVVRYLDSMGREHTEEIENDVAFYQQRVRQEGLTVISIHKK